MSGSVGILSSTPAKMVSRRILRRVLPLLDHPLTKRLLILIAVGVCFQLLAPTVPKEHPATLTQLISMTMVGMGEYLPAWFGWWEVSKPVGQFHPKFPSAREIEQEAEKLLPLIRDLQASSTYFRIFKVDLGKECPFWARDDLCSSPLGSCAVCECTDDQIPLPWRQKPTEHLIDRRFLEHFTPWQGGEDHMSGLTGPTAEAEDLFLNLIAGSHENGHPTYVDLTLNPPGFTAYRGRNIWGMIYKENCMPPNPLSVERESPKQCTEEDMFKHIISGLQTVIMVLSSEYNAPTSSKFPTPFSAPTWSREGKNGVLSSRHRYNLDLFRRRVATHREWIENLYMDFSLLVRTLVEVKGIVESCPCNTGNFVEDQQAKLKLENLVSAAQSMPSAAHHRLEVPMFERKQELALKQFANISRIFDCIECEKCRLHGKVKLTALQIAIKATGGGSPRQKVMSLERNELTALINAMGYFADSIQIIQKMERRAQHLRLLTGVFVIAVGTCLVHLGIGHIRGKPVAAEEFAEDEQESAASQGVDEVEQLLASTVVGLQGDSRLTLRPRNTKPTVSRDPQAAKAARSKRSNR